jgi:NADPH-dependent 2,4-dienoyl-CoA reductase/sulfur reductase-like enzyme/nitrite reductase/ring-hydroxylating ferredoxin subunit
MADAEPTELTGPDFCTDGISADQLPEGQMLLGHADGEAVVLARRGDEFFAVGATCTHYGGPLAEGLFDGQRLRCPWHHACFDVRTGEAIRAPALDPVDTYSVERRDGRVFVGAKNSAPQPGERIEGPSSVLIIGAGAAGNAAAESLRREGYRGSVTIIGPEDEVPYDRPNLSKDYLAGNAEESWIPLRSREFYAGIDVDLVLGHSVAEIQPAQHAVILDDGSRMEYGALLLATGATPIRLDMPGNDLPHVHTLRSLADSRAIIEAAGRVESAVVIGASFIGLEVAASLRDRGLTVHVVAPEAVPMERILGPDLGRFIRELHEAHGVQFHLGQTVAAIDTSSVTLKDRSKLGAELVVMGVGVRPAVELAERAGLATDKGITVDENLRTSDADVFAAGDIARWPDSHSGKRIRVEHWVVAERQGAAAARNMLGMAQPFDDVPFFWSQHYDVQINYVGHAEEWDTIDVAGSLAERQCIVAFRKAGETLAVASIGRDLDSLKAEFEMEQNREDALQALIPGRS